MSEFVKLGAALYDATRTYVPERDYPVVATIDGVVGCVMTASTGTEASPAVGADLDLGTFGPVGDGRGHRMIPWIDATNDKGASCTSPTVNGGP